ncbi:MAG: hypothetical protein HYU60_00265 [Magnetospirillum sp.]|nr:hypothetical protein [Magnetospirillum sp.]
MAFAAFIITTDKPQLPRDTAAINMAEDLLLRLPGQRWGQAGVYGVDEAKIKAENLYSSSVDNVGMSLWAVAWTQKVRMGTNAYPQGPILSEEAYAGGGA